MKFEGDERKEIETHIKNKSLEMLKKMNIPEKYVNVRCNVDGFDDETRVHFKISLNLPDDIWHSLDLSHAKTNNEAPNI